MSDSSMSVEVYEDNGRFALIDAKMPDHNGIFVTYTLVVPDFWLMAVDNSNGKKETYCAYKNCKDINVAVKSREVPRTDWPTYLAELRKMFVNFKSAIQQLALAVEQTDLSGEEEAAAEQGRGKRPKRAPARYGQSSLEESNQDSSDDQQDASHMLANCPSFPNNRGFYTSTQYSPSGIDSSQSSNLPRHINDAEQPPAGVSTPRFVLCQQDSESMEFGSASVGDGEDSQLDSQLIGSPSLIDNVDIEPIDNPGAVNRRPLPTVAKRLPFPSTNSRPSATSVASRPVTTGVVSRPLTSANTIQRFSSGVSTQPTSANNRQLVIPAVDWQEESESMDFGSASVGVGEDSQLDSQLNGSPILSDNVDSEPIGNPGAVNRRPLPTVAKRLPFPSNTSRPSATSVASRPATTGVVSRPSTSANTNQRFSSGVSTQHTSANNRQFVIQAVDSRPQLAGRQTTSAGIGDEASGENRSVFMATDERPVRRARIDGMENIDSIRIYKGILKLTIEVNELKDLITVLTKICVSKADSHTEGSETLDEIPISSVETFKAFEIKLKDSGDKYSSLVKFIKCIGGNSEGDAVQRAWEKLTTIDCRAHCNFNGVRRGQNQKYPLKGSIITAAVFDGIRANSQFASCTDATLEHETTYCGRTSGRCS